MTRAWDAYGDAENIDVSAEDWTPSKANVSTAAILVDTSSGNAADIRIQTARGTILTLQAVPTGTLIPIEVRRVYNEGTTADRTIALYW